MIAYADALMQAGRFEDALQVYRSTPIACWRRIPPKFWKRCTRMIGHVRDNTAALENLLALLNKAGENTHHTEVYELLAHAYVQSGQIWRKPANII